MAIHIGSDSKLVVTLSWKIIAVVLAVALLALTVYTKPWEGSSKETRTITETGQATIMRVPDSFLFYPSYEAESQAAINAKTVEVLAGLKATGLEDKGIKTNVSNYDEYGGDSYKPTGKKIYSLSLTLTVEDKAIAQKVQDYLSQSSALNSISPIAEFSEATQKQLKEEATAIAIENAKVQAEKTAQYLGTKLGKVISVKESSSGIGPYPMAEAEMRSSTAVDSSAPITVGENEYNYMAEVVFEIK